MHRAYCLSHGDFCDNALGTAHYYLYIWRLSAAARIVLSEVCGNFEYSLR